MTDTYLPSSVKGSCTLKSSLASLLFYQQTSVNWMPCSVCRSCLCSTAAPKTPLSLSLLPTGSPSSPWMPTSGRDGCTCIASLSSSNMTCKHWKMKKGKDEDLYRCIFPSTSCCYSSVLHHVNTSAPPKACPQTPAHSWKQWALQHHPVSYLPHCPHIPAEGLEQLCVGGGLLICETHIQVRQQKHQHPFFIHLYWLSASVTLPCFQNLIACILHVCVCHSYLYTSPTAAILKHPLHGPCVLLKSIKFKLYFHKHKVCITLNVCE